ncbi:zinc finger, zz type domain-containing protein [Besnoitia besnoiti]|uniref:Zinc finger, zz type domain-containing protein n=1 Tax=Besnoitia besnoiti TaxID=94643 RepID=A0A2A9MK06_BESBE|nr:zinc finger, zz type domain-containing protein [Besnoitia besnoiti]PFH37524.1 zinc finger, zz type domain-containing protein [Besnoitia besnoiti]
MEKRKRRHADGGQAEFGEDGGLQHEQEYPSAKKHSKSGKASGSSEDRKKKEKGRRTDGEGHGYSHGTGNEEAAVGRSSRRAEKKYRGNSHASSATQSSTACESGGEDASSSDQDVDVHKRGDKRHRVADRKKASLQHSSASGDDIAESSQGAHDLFGSDSDGESDLLPRKKSNDIDKIAINKAYAEAYEVRKRREVLQKNKDLLDETDDSESSSDEDEEGDLLSERVESKILDTLARIKNKDSSVYDKKHNFFDDADFADDQDTAAIKGSSKKTTYTDMVRKTLAEHGPTAFVDEEDALSAKKSGSQAPSYRDEMDALKKAFVEAAEGVDEDDGFLQTRQKTEEELAQEEKDYKNFLSSNKGKEQTDMNAVLNRYWAPDDNLDSDERFLRDYILNQGWREDRVALFDEQKNERFDEDEDELNVDQADAFEATYNFRFEEEGGADILGHARRVEGSVRQKNDKRRRQREAKKARLAEEKAQRDEELRRLKAAKKQEILDRIRKIQEMTGHMEVDVSAIDLDADFDPEAHDKEMATMLGDDYEEREEAVEGDELLKVPTGFEQDLGISGEDDQTLQSLSKKQRKLMKLLKKRNARSIDEGEAYAPLPDGEEGDASAPTDVAAEDDSGSPPESSEQDASEWWMCDGCGNGIPGGKKRFDCLTCDNFTLCKQCYRNVRHPHQLVKRTVPLECQPPKDFHPDSSDVSKTIKEYLDEYFQTDYEDIIGKDLPTRFKYTRVRPESYGLTVEDILSKTDKELNAHVSLKKLAPYRPQVPESRRKLQRAMFWRKRTEKEAQRGGKKDKKNPAKQMTKFGITQDRLDAYGD